MSLKHTRHHVESFYDPIFNRNGKYGAGFRGIPRV